MRWFAYYILAYVALGIQIGLSGHAQVGEARINFVLVAAAFIAANAPRNAALLGCFGLGLLQDFSTINAPGLYAISYGLMAALVAGTQRAMLGEHPATHFLLTLVGGLIAAAVLWLHGRFAPLGVAVPVGPLLVSAVYSAVVALPLLWLLTRLKKFFRFRRRRNFGANG